MSQSYTAAPPAARLLEQSAAVRRAALVLLFGALTALSAQIRWHLPGNPVPITAQVFVVLLAGALLGARLGAASQLAYIGFGLLGAPVFASGLSGPAALIGPTGGYLLGFVLGAAVVGMAAGGRGRPVALALGMAAGLGVIYLSGAGWLACWTHLVQGVAWAEAVARGFAVGVAPFVAPDLVKVLLAFTVARRALR